METVWQELIELNSKGVALMQQGELDGAKISFTRGLRLLQSNIDSIEAFTPSQMSTCTSMSVPIFSHGRTAQSNDYVALFDRAIVFHGEDKPNISIDQRLSACSGFFLYNLALTMHVRGLPQGDTKQLSQALQMYTLAWDALMNSGADDTRSKLGLLACINNIAHLHRYHHRIPDVISCGRWIWQRLHNAGVPHEEHSLLVSNVMFYSQNELSSAAAA